MTTTLEPRPRSTHAPGPRRGLLWLGGIAAGGIGLSAVYAATGMGIRCPFYEVTGLWCPLCGGTRMGAALLHGDVGAAFWFNPLAFVGLIVATFVGLAWLVQLAGGPTPPLPAALRRVRFRTWMWALAAVAVVFTVARNLPV